MRGEEFKERGETVSRDHAAAALRVSLMLLALWDLLCGSTALLWPATLGQARGAETAAEFHWIRVIGVFWIYLAFMQGLGAWDLRRFLVAAQLAIALRCPTSLFHLANLILGSGAPLQDLAFGVADLIIWLGGWWLLRRAGLRLLG
jgi:hypothetical protein